MSRQKIMVRSTDIRITELGGIEVKHTCPECNEEFEIKTKLDPPSCSCGYEWHFTCISWAYVDGTK